MVSWETISAWVTKEVHGKMESMWSVKLATAFSPQWSRITWDNEREFCSAFEALSNGA
jgi:hypothetical protein